MILLDGDVSGLGLGAINLVLLLDHDSCQTSSSGRVTKNVSDVVVAKHKGRTVVTAGSVISKHVHLLRTSLAVTTAERRTRKRRIEEWNSQSELESRSEDIRLEPKTKTGNWRRKQPITGSIEQANIKFWERVLDLDFRSERMLPCRSVDSSC